MSTGSVAADRGPATCSYKLLPKVSMNVPEMNVVGHRLHGRVQTEIQRYFPSPTDDQLLAMACHPIMATCGFPALTSVYSNLDAITEKAKGMLVQQCLDLGEHKTPKTVSRGPGYDPRAFTEALAREAEDILHVEEDDDEDLSPMMRRINTMRRTIATTEEQEQQAPTDACLVI